MKNIVILISGGGSNMAAIVRAAEQGRWAEARGPYRKRMERDEYHARNYHSDRATPEWDMRVRVGVLAVHGEREHHLAVPRVVDI